MQGLAKSMVQPEQSEEITLDQIIQMLMQGVDPDAIVEMGVNPQLIVEAITILEQKLAAEAQPEQGLAAVSTASM
jgi:hypothetical protein